MSSPSAKGIPLTLAALAALAAASADGSEQVRQWHAVAVEGGSSALARAAGLEAGLPAWRVLYEACRRPPGAARAPLDDASGGPEAGAGAGAVPLPLGPAWWRGVMRKGSGVPDARLAEAIVRDPRAALLYRGLAGLDEETLAALSADADGLRRLGLARAQVLAKLGSRFLVRDGSVAVPGGLEAWPAWQAVVGASPRAPSRFLLRLLEARDGRLAFLYDSLARLDPARQRLALGLPSPPGADAARALGVLADAFAHEQAWWRMQRGAYARPEADAARALRELRLAADGTIAAPASAAFWEAVFDGTPVTSQATTRSEPVRAAWLAARVGAGDARTRRLRLEQLSFAQRVFGAAAEASPAEAVRALSGLVDARALLLALERFGSRDPALFAEAAAWSRASLPPSGSRDKHAVVQGVLGVIDRACFRGALDRATSERLVRSLIHASPAQGASWPAALAAWIERTLLPALAEAVGGVEQDPDTLVLRALAGATPALAGGPAFEWQGRWYQARPALVELARLERVRRRQNGRALREALRECRVEPAGASPARCASALGTSLVSLVYAAHLGEPEGPALRGEDPALRHAFLPDPWALPSERSGPAVEWHVEGSLLGLETALARLSLQRLDPDALPEATPVVDPEQRHVLAMAVGLARAVELRAADQRALAAAVASGRRRALALRPGQPDVRRAAHDAGLDPWRARALEWLLEHDAGALAGFFSLGELARLGEPEPAGWAGWDGWGTPDPLVRGLRLGFPAPRPLDERAGRPGAEALGAGFVDLGVRVAIHLAERRLPAGLAPAVAGVLLAELLVEAQPIAQDDRLALDAWIAGVSDERLDRIVVALGERGWLEPVPAPQAAP